MSARRKLLYFQTSAPAQQTGAAPPSTSPSRQPSGTGRKADAMVRRTGLTATLSEIIELQLVAGALINPRRAVFQSGAGDHCVTNPDYSSIPREYMEVRLAAGLAIEHVCPEGRRAQSGSFYTPRVVNTECHRHAGQARPLNGDEPMRTGFHAFPRRIIRAMRPLPQRRSLQILLGSGNRGRRCIPSR